MVFDLQTWKQTAKEKLQKIGNWLDRRITQNTSYVVYSALCSLTLWPLVEAARAGQLLQVMVALASVAGTVGGNLIAEQVNRWKDRTDGPTEAEVAAWVRENVTANPELRKALDSILEKLDAIPQAQAGLTEADRHWFTETLRAETNRLGNLARFEVILAPGAKVTGDRGVVANDIHGPVVTGDGAKVVHIETHIARPEISLPPHVAPAKLEASYLRRIQTICNALPLAVIDPKAVERTFQKTMDLVPLYVALNTKTQLAVEKIKVRGKGKTRQPEEMMESARETRPLSALEAAARGRQIVLLGDPGSGKSTFANYLALCLAGARLERMEETGILPGERWLAHIEPIWTHGPLLPLQIILRQFAKSEWCNGTAQGLWDFVKETLTAEGLADLVPHLYKQLFEGGVIVLLDGLDEVADPARRQIVRKAVMDFATTHKHPDNRYFVTCRGYAYQDPSCQLNDFVVHTLAPFNQEQIDHFIDCWYSEVRRLGWKTESEAQELTQRLQAATRRPDLAPLAASPLQLAMMASLHFSWGRLPDDRVELYQEMVRLLLVRWQEARLGQESGVTQNVSAGVLESVLEEVAFIAHRGQVVSEGTADISQGTLLSVLKDYLDGSWDRAGEMVAFIQDRAGLLIDRGKGTYTFPHRSYQEYLAGSHLAVQPDFPDEAARLARANYTQWREVLLWAVGAMTRLKKMPHLAVDAVAALCSCEVSALNVPEEDWRMASLAGEALLEIGLKEVKARDRHAQVLGRVQAWLVALIEWGVLTPTERAAAGRTLAKLGDSRDSVITLEKMQFCLVPPGPFWMGEGKEEHLNEELIKYYYWISRYPVTNTQFKAFVDAGGYNDKSWWTEDGWRYKKKEDLKVAREFGEPFNLSNHPVVGVSWYEALAFTRWLTEQFGNKIRKGYKVQLPSEAEWEKAARGGVEITDKHIISNWEMESGDFRMIENPHHKRTYPWEGDPDPNKANYYESGIGNTSAVGCFPKGTSPYGVMDMSGNVWEWCMTKWQESYKNYKNDNNPEGDEPRVLRGGSFINNGGDVCCAGRYRDFPGCRFNCIGFRVVVSPL